MKLVNIEETFSEMLDACYEYIKIGTLTYAPSAVLKSVDPVAFRLESYNYIDTLLQDGVVVEENGEFYWSE